MNFVKDKWSKFDKQEFIDYLLNIKRKEKVEWTKRIVNTSMDVLAISYSELKKISKQIVKGNFLSFLDLEIYDYFECSIINAYLITYIKDFKVQKKYLDRHVNKIDNWASVDSVSLKIDGNEDNYMNLSKIYLSNSKPFVRRMGVIILFNFLNKKEYLDDVFSLIKNDNHYYVNMAYSWLLCESFIKNRNATIEYLNNCSLSKDIINKFVSKCRDSYRVSLEDKKMLVKYRIK